MTDGIYSSSFCVLCLTGFVVLDTTDQLSGYKYTLGLAFSVTGTLFTFCTLTYKVYNKLSIVTSTILPSSKYFIFCDDIILLALSPWLFDSYSKSSMQSRSLVVVVVFLEQLKSFYASVRHLMIALSSGQSFCCLEVVSSSTTWSSRCWRGLDSDQRVWIASWCEWPCRILETE